MIIIDLSVEWSTFLWPLATCWPHQLRRSCSGCVLTLLHHLLLVHFLRVINVNIGSLLFRYDPLLLLIVIQNHTQVVKHSWWDLVPEVLNGWRNLIQVHLKNVVLSVSWIIISASNSKSTLTAKRKFESKTWSWVRLRSFVSHNQTPIIIAVIKFKSVLDGSHLVDGNKVFNNHVVEFKLSHNISVLLLQFFSFLNHELLNIVVCFVCCFELIVDLG